MSDGKASREKILDHQVENLMKSYGSGFPKPVATLALLYSLMHSVIRERKRIEDWIRTDEGERFVIGELQALNAVYFLGKLAGAQGEEAYSEQSPLLYAEMAECGELAGVEKGKISRLEQLAFTEVLQNGLTEAVEKGYVAHKGSRLELSAEGTRRYSILLMQPPLQN